MIKIHVRRNIPEDKKKDAMTLIIKLRSMSMGKPGYISGETLKRIDKPGESLVVTKWKSVHYWNQWFESKEMNLSTTAGPMYADEDFDNNPDDDYIALGWGIDFDRYVFGEFMQLYHRQNGLWSMDDTSDLVWNTWTGLRFPLVLGLVASTEMQVEYDSGAADEADDLDTTYTLKLGYAW